MNFLGKAFGQISDLFLSMTPGARITAGLLMAVVVISVGYLFNRQVSGPDVYLLGGQAFSRSELNAMEAAFGEAGLNNYETQNNRIRIPRAQRAEFLGAIAQNNAMPADFSGIMHKMLDADGPFLPRKAREQRLKIATQEFLALSIRGMKGIERASVLYDVKTTGGLTRETIATASVSVKPVGSQLLDENQVRDIRSYVAGAIAELKPENVAVSDQNGRTYPAGDSDDVNAHVSNARMLKVKDEQRWVRTILNRLSYIHGVVVAVNVELDSKVRTTTKTVKFDTKAVIVRSESDSSDETTSRGVPSGRPGTVPNQANTSAAVAAKSGAESSKTFASESTEGRPSGTETEIFEIGQKPQRVTVSIGIPHSH